MIPLPPKAKKYAWIGGIFLVVILIAYLKGRANKKPGGKKFKPQYNPGSTNWSPKNTVLKVHGAMKGAGTYEDVIFDALDPLNDSQLIAVYNDFGIKDYSGFWEYDLLGWFAQEMSGDDLDRALGYFDGLID